MRHDWNRGRVPSLFHRLTRHFFSGLFDFGFLSDAGVRSFTRLILGFYAVFFGLGLLLVRVYMAKYASLMDRDSPEPYLRAVVADHTFLIAVPMWIVAFVTILVGHAVFPDETDFRVLMALPITRRLVFGAKLSALALFSGLFILGAQVSLGPIFLLTAISPWAEQSFPSRAFAYGAATILASVFAILAIVAAQGIILIGAPRGRLTTFAAALRSGMLCALVISLPLLMRLPFQTGALNTGASWVYLAPPAWFMGLERLLLGDGRDHIHQLSVIALAAMLLVSVAAAASYALLYRRFDRVMSRSTMSSQRWRDRGTKSWAWRTRRPVLAAIRSFTSITLRRSVLHQGIVVALSAVGLGLAVNTFVRADLVGWLASGEPVRARLVESVIWAPFALIFVAVLAVRVALHVPVELKANWIFRIIEHDERRIDQLSAGVRSVMSLGVVAPALLALPVQWMVLGERALLVLGSTILWGWLFVEIVMRDWGRIPFTCSYIPGKGFLPQTVLKGLFSFVLFTTVGSALARFVTTTLPFAFYLETVVLFVAGALARRRITIWKHTSLAFEDDLPTDINPLRLMD